MAGVINNCKECGFVIFDEQTKTMLCDECSKLAPIDRLSARAQKAKQEEEIKAAAIDFARRNNELRELRRNLERRLQSELEKVNNDQLKEENERLQEEVKSLRRKLSASEIHDDDIQEVKTFLRRFDNLLLESETEGEV